MPLIRAGRDEDAALYIALIGRCWADYPGCVLDVDGEAPELRALASYYSGRGGVLYVAEPGDGMVATMPHGDGSWEICRLYVHPDRHGGGLGAQLLNRAERHAERSGAAGLFLWTDTRFARAHRFYEKHGYRRRAETRALHDLAATVEFRYERAMPQSVTTLTALAVGRSPA